MFLYFGHLPFFIQETVTITVPGVFSVSIPNYTRGVPDREQEKAHHRVQHGPWFLRQKSWLLFTESLLQSRRSANKCFIWMINLFTVSQQASDRGTVIPAFPKFHCSELRTDSKCMGNQNPRTDRYTIPPKRELSKNKSKNKAEVLYPDL